jgi:hypothetical protein
VSKQVPGTEQLTSSFQALPTASSTSGTGICDTTGECHSSPR